MLLNLDGSLTTSASFLNFSVTLALAESKATKVASLAVPWNVIKRRESDWGYGHDIICQVCQVCQVCRSHKFEWQKNTLVAENQNKFLKL